MVQDIRAGRISAGKCFKDVIFAAAAAAGGCGRRRKQPEVIRPASALLHYSKAEDPEGVQPAHIRTTHLLIRDFKIRTAFLLQQKGLSGVAAAELFQIRAEIPCEIVIVRYKRFQADGFGQLFHHIDSSSKFFVMPYGHHYLSWWN